MNTGRRRRFTLSLAAVALGTVMFGAQTLAQDGSADRRPSFQDAVGSWFGRAVPVPVQTICPPGPGCRSHPRS